MKKKKNEHECRLLYHQFSGSREGDVSFGVLAFPLVFHGGKDTISD